MRELIAGRNVNRCRALCIGGSCRREKDRRAGQQHCRCPNTHEYLSVRREHIVSDQAHVQETPNASPGRPSSLDRPQSVTARLIWFA